MYVDSTGYVIQQSTSKPNLYLPIHSVADCTFTIYRYWRNLFMYFILTMLAIRCKFAPVISRMTEASLFSFCTHFIVCLFWNYLTIYLRAKKCHASVTKTVIELKT